MKILILTIYIALSNYHTFGQEMNFGCPKIYQVSKDVFDTSCKDCLKHIRKNVFTDYIVAIDKNNSKINIPLNSVWGYRRMNDYPIRIVAKKDYTLIRTSPIYVYRQGSTKIRHYYFSTDLDGKLFSLTKKELKKVFITDSTYNDIVKDKNVKKFF